MYLILIGLILFFIVSYYIYIYLKLKNLDTKNAKQELIYHVKSNGYIHDLFKYKRDKNSKSYKLIQPYGSTIYVLKGKYNIYMNGILYSYKKGDIIKIEPNKECIFIVPNNSCDGEGYISYFYPDATNIFDRDIIV